MTITKALLALSILTAVSQSHASYYQVTGTLDAINTTEATADPDIFVHAGSTAYSTSASVWPTFTGIWEISTTATSGWVVGVFADFVQYSTSYQMMGGLLKGVVNQPSLVYSFNGGTVTYDSLTRTFTLGQTMIFPTSKLYGPAPDSDAKLKFDTDAGATLGSCTGSETTVCKGQNVQFLAKPDLESFYLTLTFSADFSSFSGTAVGVDIGGPYAGTVTTGNDWYMWSFEGTEVPPSAVPVPAAAWLLGSGLLGLVGASRRRRARI